jgi:hypothetical protein
MTVEIYDQPARMPAMLSPDIDAWIQRLEPAIRLTELTYGSELIPASFRGKKGDVLAAFIRSGELHLSPFTGVSQMHSINGRVGISAELMRALILRAGHDYHIEGSDARACTIRGRRSDWDESRWTTVTFTIEDAVRAGLLEDKKSRDGKVTPSLYKKWPAALLLARASTILARMIFPDVIAGLQSLEELQDMVEPSEWVQVDGPAPTATVSRQGAGSGQAAPADRAVAQGVTGTAEATGAAESEQQPQAAPAAGRKRAPLKPRGRTQPVPEPVPDEPGLDAETVEEAPEHSDPAPVVSIDQARADARRKLMTPIQMHWQRLLGEPVKREDRLWWTALIVDHPVESTNDLTDDELHKVLKTVERLRNYDQLKALAVAAEDGE